MDRKALVTGATGYVGSRLIPALLEGGVQVRAASRNPERLEKAHEGVEWVPADVQDKQSLVRALDGIDIAYYLVHSMSGSDFEQRDRSAAHNFAAAAAGGKVGRIVYLSGLGHDDDRLSRHLKSRQEVGRILREGSVPVTELRAAIVIGSGSVAFDMLRYLTERLPAMIAPRWLDTRIQPIGERDLIAYLLAAAARQHEGSHVVEIGGEDVLTYRDMILGYGAERRLRRLIVRIPLLTPRLSSYWVDLVTPISASIARPLIDGLRNEVVVHNDSGRKLFPDIAPSGYRQAVIEALRAQVDVLTKDGPSAPGALTGILCNRERASTEATPSTLVAELHSIGGDSRWYPLRWAWWIRARLDDLFGGAGLRWVAATGPLRPGACVDWWTVSDVADDRLLLKADMRVPGEAWVEWRVIRKETGSELMQSAYFRPRGLLGRLYWWVLYPAHAPIFRLMARRIARRASTLGNENGLPS